MTTLAPSSIVSAEAAGTPVARIPIALAPGSAASGEAFGTPAVALLPAAPRGFAAGTLAPRRYAHSATSSRWEGLLG